MKIENKTVKYTFSHNEREQLGGELARSFGALRGIEAEFDQVKASYKSRTAEAEAKIDRISTNITNGFDMRDVDCFVAYRASDKEKDYYLLEEAAIAGDRTNVVLTERMTADDFQQELIEAESAFDAREELELFTPVGDDRGVLVVGRMAGKWFSALRVKIGKLEINERLDAEQKCCINRSDAVASAVKRANDWSKKNLKALADGFQSKFNAVADSQKERVE